MGSLQSTPVWRSQFLIDQCPASKPRRVFRCLKAARGMLLLLKSQPGTITGSFNHLFDIAREPFDGFCRYVPPAFIRDRPHS